MELLSGVAVLVIGLGVAFVIGLIIAYARFYVKAPSSQAFVRTGSGKAKVVLDGGTWVIPLLHENRWVSLETMRIEVSRQNDSALITGDKLRADVTAEFYIRVEPTEQQILAASRSLGSRSVSEEEIDQLIAPKLISALRSVAAQKSLLELHEKRDEFADAVQNIVKNELDENGLLLETVTVSNLDASTFRSDENYFDAQGVSHITQTIQEASRRKNEIEQTTKEDIARKNVDTRKQILLLDQEQKQAELNQELEINRMSIEQRRLVESETAEKSAEQEKVKLLKEREVRESQIQQDLTVENAKISSDIQLIERRREKDTADELAKVSVEKARMKAELEIIEQNKQKEVASADAQAQVLLKEKERLEFDAQRERAKQELLTVEKIEQAKRDAEIERIDAAMEAQKEKIAREMEIEVNATRIQREAQAKFEASDLEAKATERLAQAQLAKAKSEAEGERLMMEAKNLLGTNLILQELVKVLPDIMREMAAPVSKINDIKLIQMGNPNGENGGGTGAGLGDTIMKSTLLYPVINELMDANGLDLGQFLKDLMGKAGVNGGTDTVPVKATAVKGNKPKPPEPPAKK